MSSPCTERGLKTAPGAAAGHAGLAGRLGERITVFFSQSWVSFLGLYGWLRPEIFVTAKVITPVFQVLFFACVARYARGLSDVSFYVIGNAFIACHTGAIFGMGVVLRSERFFGTLPLVMAAPTSRFFICAGRGLFYVLDGFLTALLALAAGALAFGLDLSHLNPGGLLAAALAGTVAATCLGLFLGAWGLKLTDVNLILNLATYSLLVMCGANFPVEALPAPVRAASWALPLTRAIKAARLAFAGSPWRDLVPLLGGELAVAAAYLVAGYLMFAYLETRARRDGAFEFY